MRYIRTEDGNIFDTEQNSIGKYGSVDVNWVFDNGYAICYSKRDMKAVCNHGKIVKEDDNLNRLFDAYIIMRDGLGPVVRDNSFSELVFVQDLKRSDNRACIYGAIWTYDKFEPALKSVARLNNEGELELL